MTALLELALAALKYGLTYAISSAEERAEARRQLAEGWAKAQAEMDGFDERAADRLQAALAEADKKPPRPAP